MEEKILLNKKHGMAVLLVTLILYFAAVAGCIFGGIILGDNGNAVLLIVSIVWLCIGWIPFCGLKILEPQEALVLTSDAFRKICGNSQRRRILFCKSVLHRCKSCGRYPSESER